MAIQSLQELIYSTSVITCEKTYQNKVMDFITRNHFLTINKDYTYTSEKVTGNSETKIQEK